MLASAGYLLTMLADCVIYYVYGKQRNGLSNDGDLELQVAGCAHNGKGSSNGTRSESQFQAYENSDSHLTKAPVVNVTSPGDSILLIVLLCFHLVFEAIAIGVAETKADA